MITDFKVKKDAIGLVYALDLKFKQKGDDLMITGNDSVRTLLLDVDKEKFLANFPDNLQGCTCSGNQSDLITPRQFTESVPPQQRGDFLWMQLQAGSQNKKRKRWLLASLASAPLLFLAGHSVSR